MKLDVIAKGVEIYTKETKKEAQELGPVQPSLKTWGRGGKEPRRLRTCDK